MKKKTEYTKKEILALQKELIDLLLERANLTKEDIYDVAIRSWVSKNLDLLKPAELKKYKGIILV